jgi:hypothetical protein
LNGWIKLHRKIQENPIYSNPYMLKLWIHCLMKATHKEVEQLVGNQIIKLQPGQFVTGRDALAEEFNKGAKPEQIVSARTLWRYMKNFEKWQMLSIKSTNKFSVITINNWHQYQDIDQQLSSNCPTTVQQLSTNKNEKNDKNNKKLNNKRYVFDEKQMKLAELLWKCIRINHPTMKKPSLESWANTIRLMMERDQREGKEIQEVILWATKHHFWYKNILSADKLRKQFDRLLIQMKDEQKRGKANAIYQPSYGEEEQDLSEKRSW